MGKFISKCHALFAHFSKNNFPDSLGRNSRSNDYYLVGMPKLIMFGWNRPSDLLFGSKHIARLSVIYYADFHDKRKHVSLSLTYGLLSPTLNTYGTARQLIHYDVTTAVGIDDNNIRRLPPCY